MFRTFREWLQLRLEQAPAGTTSPPKATPGRELAFDVVNQTVADQAAATKQPPDQLLNTPAGQADIMKKATATAKKSHPGEVPNVGAMAQAANPDAVDVTMSKRMRKK